MQNAINNQARAAVRGGGVGARGGITGKPRIPKQPHQHFIESSKVKRTLAPSSRKPQFLMHQDAQTQRQSFI